MASAIYPKAKESFLSQNPSIDLDTDTIRCIFLLSTYTYSTSHQYFSDLGANALGDGGTGRANGEALASVTITNGVLDAADTVFAAVGSGSESVNAIAIYKDDGSADATSPLIAYIDGISFTANGGQVTITWDSGGNKIFAL